MNKKIITGVLATLLIVGGIFSQVTEKNDLPLAETKVAEKSVEVEKISKPAQTEKNIPKAEAAEDNLFAGMDGAIASILNDGSDYQVYIAYPEISEQYHFYTTTSQKFRSASMIKVFILATAMEKVENGTLQLNQPLTIDAHNKVGGAGILVGYPTGTQLSLEEVLTDMIIHSDNTATNMMIDLLGMDTINEYIKRNGYTDTILQRKMMDFNGRENYTSAQDLGNFFLKLYKNKVVSPASDQIMINILLGQHDTECLNTACPNKRIAHKTGALAGNFSDGGIIYEGKNGDTILVMMGENITGEKTVIGRMKKFARHIIY